MNPRLPNCIIYSSFIWKDFLNDAKPGWVENKNLSETELMGTPHARTLGTSEEKELESQDNPPPRATPVL